ncbi:MAG: GtrA family protein [Steroidobacteraceae bacterium]|jgi:putative flippase GtrA
MPAMSLHSKPLVRLRPHRHAIAHKFLRFLMVGGLCTALQYVILIALVEGLGIFAALASTIGYIVSSAVNYYLNYSFTFRSDAAHGRSVPRFLLISGCGLVLNGTITYLGTAILGLHYLIAQVAATIVALLWNFLANLRWTF